MPIRQPGIGWADGAAQALNQAGRFRRVRSEEQTCPARRPQVWARAGKEGRTGVPVIPKPDETSSLIWS